MSRIMVKLTTYLIVKVLTCEDNTAQPAASAALGDGQDKGESVGSILTTQDPAVLRRFIVKHFNDSELRDLCLDMGVDHENLSGDNKADKARELVAYCERRQIVPGLVAKCKELRPNVSWEGEYE